MLNIAVCMENLKEARGVEEKVESYLTRHPWISAAVIRVSEARLLSGRFAVILLEVSSSSPDGLETARRVREVDPSVVLILLSPTRRYAYEAYRLRALQYLLCPVDQTQLEEALDDAALQAVRGASERFAVNTTRGIRWLSLSQVVYFRSDRHVVHVVLRGGNEVVTSSQRVSFTYLMTPLLESGRFVRPHHSYVVNLDYVNRLTPDSLILQDESIVPVSRSKFSALRDLLRSGQSIT